jgi:predicted MPP superfamily phosphohydrolase
MSLFLVVFFLVYGGMHLYVFIRARAAMHLNISASILTGLLMLFLCLTPLLIRTAERHGFDLIARLVSVFGYTWMGLLFFFCAASIPLDVWSIGTKIMSAVIRSDLSGFKPSAVMRFYLPFAVSVLIFLYGYFEARNIRTEHITIMTEKLPASVNRLRIVQISDVHIGLIVRKYKLARMLKLVKEAGPDILVSTGDLVDGQINGLPGLAEMLASINPPYGKYAVSGNHEYYAGLGQAGRFIENAGFRLLRNEGTAIPGVINIAGVDDPTGTSQAISSTVHEKDLLSGLSPGLFTLFLKHRPLIENGSAGLFDLQLSGHVHKGQIFPFSMITFFYYPVHAGLADAGMGSKIYVSRGTGTWGPPIRVLSPPEVTVIDLVRATS